MIQQDNSATRDPHNQSNYATNLRRNFGEIGDFWDRYDKLADSHDQRLIRNLNDNLNILLIVAGLFSAVNISVIQLATPSLTQDPAAETNHLLRLIITRLDNTTFPPTPEPPSQNTDLLPVWAGCLLYSSLTCSILVAVGGMLAKEWLQTFERGGQIGLLQDQALRRQRKLSGAQRWQFEPIIRLLPTLLLISVGLFFCGLIDYLILVDYSAAGAVMALTILGSIFYTLTTSAAVIWEDCPFETLVSKASKYLLEEILIPFIRRLRRWLMGRFGWHEPAKELPTLRTATSLANYDDDVVKAQAACWLLETTSSPDDQLVAIRNLITLAPGASSFLIQNRYTYERILSLAIRFIRNWQEEPSTKTLLTAQQFSGALLHLFVGYPKHSANWTTMRERLSAQIGVGTGEHPHGEHLSDYIGLYLSDSAASYRINPASIFPYNDYNMKVVTLSMIVLGDIPFWSFDRKDAWSALWHLFGDKYDDTILALVALTILKGFSTSHPSSKDPRILLQRAWSGKDVFEILMEAVRSGPIALCEDARPSYIHALPVFSEILRCLGEIPSTKAIIELHPEALLHDVAGLILAVDGAHATAQSLGAADALGQFMAGALRLLRICKPPETEPAPLLFNGTLVAFIRSNQYNSSISATAMQTLDWLNLCLRKSNSFVAGRTISYMMWGLETIESREDMLQLFYTYTSKWFAYVGEEQFRRWALKGLVPQLLQALSSGTSAESINLMVPLALRHVVNRAKSMSWELQESEEIVRFGIEVVNSVNSNTGTVGQAYSLLTFEVVLSIWETLSEERRAKGMSEGMVGATTRILLGIEELLGHQPGKTLTAALRSKIGFIVCSEQFSLSHIMLRKFLSELTVKQADVCARAGLDAIVIRVDSLLFNGTTPRAQT